eukprot:m.166941 g.166941  ORF g.166941 m.166941 type:complete len:367 (-) comp15298_c0_seq2:1220-2320(-)
MSEEIEDIVEADEDGQLDESDDEQRISSVERWVQEQKNQLLEFPRHPSDEVEDTLATELTERNETSTTTDKKPSNVNVPTFKRDLESFKEEEEDEFREEEHDCPDASSRHVAGTTSLSSENSSGDDDSYGDRVGRLHKSDSDVLANISEYRRRTHSQTIGVPSRRSPPLSFRVAESRGLEFPASKNNFGERRPRAATITNALERASITTSREKARLDFAQNPRRSNPLRRRSSRGFSSLASLEESADEEEYEPQKNKANRRHSLDASRLHQHQPVWPMRRSLSAEIVNVTKSAIPPWLGQVVIFFHSADEFHFTLQSHRSKIHRRTSLNKCESASDVSATEDHSTPPTSPTTERSYRFRSPSSSGF